MRGASPKNSPVSAADAANVTNRTRPSTAASVMQRNSRRQPREDERAEEHTRRRGCRRRGRRRARGRRFRQQLADEDGRARRRWPGDQISGAGPRPARASGCRGSRRRSAARSRPPPSGSRAAGCMSTRGSSGAVARRARQRHWPRESEAQPRHDRLELGVRGPPRASPSASRPRIDRKNSVRDARRSADI